MAAASDKALRGVLAAGLAVGAGALGVAASLFARSRKAARNNADLWSQATRGVAERDLTPPSTVAVDSSRRPRH